MRNNTQITFRNMPHDGRVASLAVSEARSLMRRHRRVTWVHVVVAHQRIGYEVKIIVQLPGCTLVERHYPEGDDGSHDPLASVARAFESAAEMIVFHEDRWSRRPRSAFAGHETH